MIRRSGLGVKQYIRVGNLLQYSDQIRVTIGISYYLTLKIGVDILRYCTILNKARETGESSALRRVSRRRRLASALR